MPDAKAYCPNDAAEAADLLARRAVASRRCGGFVKTADLKDIMTQLQGYAAKVPEYARQAGDYAKQTYGGLSQEQQTLLKNTGIGAGIGGLGGLAVGLGQRKKKNPLSTALTGALLGGIGTGAGTALTQYVPKMFEKTVDIPPDPGVVRNAYDAVASTIDEVHPGIRQVVDPVQMVHEAKKNPAAGVGGVAGAIGADQLLEARRNRLLNLKALGTDQAQKHLGSLKGTMRGNAAIDASNEILSASRQRRALSNKLSPRRYASRLLQKAMPSRSLGSAVAIGRDALPGGKYRKLLRLLRGLGVAGGTQYLLNQPRTPPAANEFPGQ